MDRGQLHHLIFITGFIGGKGLLWLYHFAFRQCFHQLRCTRLVIQSLVIVDAAATTIVRNLVIILIIFLCRRLLNWALVTTIKVIKRTVKKATSLIIWTINFILGWGRRHIVEHMLHQKLGGTTKHRIFLSFFILHAEISLMVDVAINSLVNGTVLNLNRIYKSLDHLVFSLCWILLNNFVGQLLPRWLWYINAKARHLVVGVADL